MSLSLKLELKSDDQVIIINSLTNESKKVSIGFLQRVTNNSLATLFQYKYYELIINAEEIWRSIEYFDSKREEEYKIYIEQQFRRIMSNNNWLEIADYDRKIYEKALSSWANSYNSQPNKKGFDKFVFIPVAGGAMAGALTYSAIGGVGIAAAGSAVGIGALGLTALGTIGGLAAYGVGKAVS